VFEWKIPTVLVLCARKRRMDEKVLWKKGILLAIPKMTVDLAENKAGAR
jgi:hypothetical protein